MSSLVFYVIRTFNIHTHTHKLITRGPHQSQLQFSIRFHYLSCCFALFSFTIDAYCFFMPCICLYVKTLIDILTLQHLFFISSFHLSIFVPLFINKTCCNVFKLSLQNPSTQSVAAQFTSWHSVPWTRSVTHSTPTSLLLLLPAPPPPPPSSATSTPAPKVAQTLPPNLPLPNRRNRSVCSPALPVSSPSCVPRRKGPRPTLFRTRPALCPITARTACHHHQHNPTPRQTRRRTGLCFTLPDTASSQSFLLLMLTTLIPSARLQPTILTQPVYRLLRAPLLVFLTRTLRPEHLNCSPIKVAGSEHSTFHSFFTFQLFFCLNSKYCV